MSGKINEAKNDMIRARVSLPPWSHWKNYRKNRASELIEDNVLFSCQLGSWH